MQDKPEYTRRRKHTYRREGDVGELIKPLLLRIEMVSRKKAAHHIWASSLSRAYANMISAAHALDAYRVKWSDTHLPTLISGKKAERLASKINSAVNYVDDALLPKQLLQIFMQHFRERMMAKCPCLNKHAFDSPLSESEMDDSPQNILIERPAYET